MTNTKIPAWWQYNGFGKPHNLKLPRAPQWRQFGQLEEDPNNSENVIEADYYAPITDSKISMTRDEIHAAQTFEPTRRMIELVNAALYLRRPLLITGGPGTGKSSLAYAVAYELQLGRVLTWPVTSRSTLQEALYQYDALGRLQDTNLERSSGRQAQTNTKAKASKSQQNKTHKPANIGQYIRLGPLGTALLPTRQPQVLLIDEIDKSSIDLPNDLLHIFETGSYEIPELSRLPDEYVDVMPQFGEQTVRIHRGKVTAHEFPFVIMTSNGERDLPPPFLRRCIRLDVKDPTDEQLARIIEKKFPESSEELRTEVLSLFQEKRKGGGVLATDQLLNAIYLRLQNVSLLADLDEDQTDTELDQQIVKDKLKDAILRKLNEQG